MSAEKPINAREIIDKKLRDLKAKGDQPESREVLVFRSIEEIDFSMEIISNFVSSVENLFALKDKIESLKQHIDTKEINPDRYKDLENLLKGFDGFSEARALHERAFMNLNNMYKTLQQTIAMAIVFDREIDEKSYQELNATKTKIASIAEDYGDLAALSANIIAKIKPALMDLEKSKSVKFQRKKRDEFEEVASADVAGLVSSPRVGRGARSSKAASEWLSDTNIDKVRNRLNELKLKALLEKFNDNLETWGRTPPGDQRNKIEAFLKNVIKYPGWGVVAGDPYLAISSEEADAQIDAAYLKMKQAKLEGTESISDQVLSQYSLLCDSMVAKEGETAGTTELDPAELYPFPIFCIYGPPGTGKTTLVEALAESMGYGYHRTVLSGKSETEIVFGRGPNWQQPTPGLIADAMIKTGKEKVVILLDEAEKAVGGLPDALGEITEPSQRTYEDSYFGMQINKRKACFFMTVNDLSLLPEHVRDRVTKIYFPGYNRETKSRILRSILTKPPYARLSRIQFIPADKKSMESFERKEGRETLKGRDPIKFLIDNYITEAGVRQAKQLLQIIVARAEEQVSLESRIERGKYTASKPFFIDAEFVKKALGEPPKEIRDIQELIKKIGDNNIKLSEIRNSISSKLPKEEAERVQSKDIQTLKDNIIKFEKLQQELISSEKEIIEKLKGLLKKSPDDAEYIQQINDHMAAIENLQTADLAMINHTKKLLGLKIALPEVELGLGAVPVADEVLAPDAAAIAAIPIVSPAPATPSIPAAKAAKPEERGAPKEEKKREEKLTMGDEMRSSEPKHEVKLHKRTAKLATPVEKPKDMKIREDEKKGKEILSSTDRLEGEDEFESISQAEFETDFSAESYSGPISKREIDKKERERKIAEEQEMKKAKERGRPKAAVSPKTGVKIEGAPKKGGVAWEIPSRGEPEGWRRKEKGGIAWEIPLGDKLKDEVHRRVEAWEIPVQSEDKTKLKMPKSKRGDEKAKRPEAEDESPRAEKGKLFFTSGLEPLTPEESRTRGEPRTPGERAPRRDQGFTSRPSFEPEKSETRSRGRGGEMPSVTVGGGEWFKLFNRSVEAKLADETLKVADPETNAKITITADQTITEEKFSNFCGSLSVGIQALSEGQNSSAKRTLQLVPEPKMFDAMDIEIGPNALEAKIVRFTPSAEGTGEKGEQIDLIHLKRLEDTKSLEIVATDFLPKDEALFTMVLTAKNAAEQLGKSRSFKIGNCEENPAAAFKLFLIGKCFGLQPRFVDKPGFRNATEDAVMQPPFGEILLQSKDGEEKTISQIMTEVRQMTAVDARKPETLRLVKQYISDLKVMEGEQELDTFKPRHNR